MYLSVISAGEVSAISISSLQDGETEFSTNSIVSRSILVPATSAAETHSSPAHTARSVIFVNAITARHRTWYQVSSCTSYLGDLLQ